jgi:hypothetical protein
MHGGRWPAEQYRGDEQELDRLPECQRIETKNSAMVAFQSHRRMADTINSPMIATITATTIAIRRGISASSDTPDHY